MTDTTSGGSPVVKTEQPRCAHVRRGVRCGEFGDHAQHRDEYVGWQSPVHCDADCPGCAADEHTRLSEELDPDPQPVDHEFLAKARTARSGAELTDDEPDALDVDTVLTWALECESRPHNVHSGQPFVLNRDELRGELLRRGWVRSHPDPNDGNCWVRLTDFGRARMEGLR